MNNWIDPTVKHVWNVAMHGLNDFWEFDNRHSKQPSSPMARSYN